ncbi:bucentaur or craniofacial development-domain-containing protein [Mortierella sp. GBAus27b]|nr:bucentaur or craniofacial development-domain-containing protein [Mortierella sp. GBAus27b]
MAKPATEKPAKTQDIESDSDSSDDEDYVPNDKADLQSDGEDTGSDDSENESGTMDATDQKATRSGKRRFEGSSSEDPSKRQKGEQESTTDDQSRKSRIDALWAELNAPITKPTSRPELFAAAAAATGAVVSGSAHIGGSKPTSTGGKMVTITTTYEFAGETITVTKDVPENSKEAMESALKKNGGNSGETSRPPAGERTESASAELHPLSSSSTSLLPSTTTTPISTTSASLPSSTLAPDSTGFNSTTEGLSALSTSTDSVSSSSTTTSSAGPRVVTRPSILDSLAKQRPVRYIRKKSQLDELAATYGVKKPPKLNTLEKSKMDWNTFVGKEGIEDELKHHNKDGYMEKVAFLQRTDERRDREYQMLKKRK